MTTTERAGAVGVVPTAPAADAPRGLGGETLGPLAQLDDAAIDRIAASLYAALPGAPLPGLTTPGALIPEAPTAGTSIPGAAIPGGAAAAPISTAGASLANPQGIAPEYYFLAPTQAARSAPAAPALPHGGFGARDPGLLPGAALPPAAVVPEGGSAGAALPAPGLPGAALPPGAVVPEAAVIGTALPGAALPGGLLPPGAVIPAAALPGTIPATASPGAAGATVIPSTRAGLAGPDALDAGLPPLFDESVSSPALPAGATPYYFLTPTAAADGVPAAPSQAALPGVLSPGAALPGTAAAAATLPAAVPPGAAVAGVTPTVGAPLPSPDSFDAGLPRLFDESAAPPATPGGSTPEYYFLTPTVAPRSAPAAPVLSRRTFDVRDIRRDFPILQERIHGRPLVWLDNAATTQKPRLVIDRLMHYYEHEYSNVHRAAHTLAARSTDAYEGAREKVQRFLGAGSPNEIVFVRGTTEAVNLVANSWGRKNIGAGDEIILTTLEHHSNIVPWQFLADAVGAVLRIVPVTDRGEVLLGDYGRLLSARTRMVAITHVSNALGTILPVGEMVQAAHRHGARVLVDGAQAVSHFPVNVQALEADFYVFSGHKLFAPTGVGVLYGKKALLDEMPPWQGGGNMIQRVTFEQSTFADPPARFEAGTATLGDAVGLGAAIDYLDRIGMENVARHERELLAYGTEALRRIPGLHLIGTAPDKAGVLSFVLDGMSVEEVGSYLDQEGIAVRAGHHCAQPTMDRFGVTGTVRPSLALYNSHEDIDALVRALRKLVRR